MANTCEIPDSVKEELKKFKLSKSTSSAIIMNINKSKLEVEIEQKLENVSIEDIAADLPDSAPRYIAYSYKYTHQDGRMSMPLILIYYCPSDINPSLAMMYSSTKTRVVHASDIMKVFDCQESTLLTESWLKEKLKFFN